MVIEVKCSREYWRKSYHAFKIYLLKHMICYISFQQLKISNGPWKRWLKKWAWKLQVKTADCSSQNYWTGFQTGLLIENIFQSVSKKEDEVKKLKEKVSDIVHQEDKTKQAKLKYVHFSSHLLWLINYDTSFFIKNDEFSAFVEQENSKTQFIWHMKWKN